MNNKRALVKSFKDIVYQQQHKSRDSNRCLSGASTLKPSFLEQTDGSVLSNDWED